MSPLPRSCSAPLVSRMVRESIFEATRMAMRAGRFALMTPVMTVITSYSIHYTKLYEQPLPAGQEALLASLPRPIPLCADESCHDRSSLPAVLGSYDLINIKTDKTGGLTEALALKAEAEAAGLGIMVGCMLATSLAMAPAFVLAQGVRVVDLDGPLLLARDRPDGFAYDGALMQPCEAALWG